MANLSESVTATLFSQKDKTADTVMKHHPLLNLLKNKGRIKKRSLGYEIRKSARYNDTAVGGFYSGYDTFNLDSSVDLTAFRFAVKQVYEPFAISGRERRANRDQEQLLDLVDEKMEASLSRLKNTFSTSILGDGTGSGGLEFDGIQKMIANDPTTGTYGQIDRSVAANSWARNQTSNVTLSAANVQATITAALLPISRGADSADCGLMGSTAWKHLHSSLTAIQRINDTTQAGKGGFKELYYDGVKFWYDGGFGDETITATSVYLMNSNFITFDMDSQADFVPLAPKMDRPVDQDAFFTVLIAEGNLCCSAPALQSVIYA